MIAWIATFLAIRSLLLGVFEEKPRWLRWIDFSIFFFFVLIVFTSTFQYDPVLMMASASLIGVTVVLRLFGFYSKTKKWTMLKGMAFSAFFMLCTVNLIFSGFQRLVEEKPVAKITLAGKKMKKWVEWKNPSQDCQANWVDTYEIVLERMDGKQIGTYYIYGDLVGVRARLIRFRPLLNFLGISNVCHLEAVYNGYTSMDNHNHLPHLGDALPFSARIFSALWKKLFYAQWKSSWIKEATLESNYFPLCNEKGRPLKRTYILNVSSGGLSAQAMNLQPAATDP